MDKKKSVLLQSWVFPVGGIFFKRPIMSISSVAEVLIGWGAPLLLMRTPTQPIGTSAAGEMDMYTRWTLTDTPSC